MSKTIKVAEKFSCPGPRYISLGPNSGEKFRGILLKVLEKDTDMTIDLDGTEGYGSSFLEEVFGGLIRNGIKAEVIRSIKLISEEEPELIDEINDYIEQAIEEERQK